VDNRTVGTSYSAAVLLDGLDLPPGRRVTPTVWIGDDPAPPALWPRLRAAHPATGLWPLLIAEDPHLDADPWAEGDLYPQDSTAPDGHDPAKLLAAWWHDHTRIDAHDLLPTGTRRDVTAPFGPEWPGVADAPPPGDDPDAHGARYATELAGDGTWRPGLVAAWRGADALAVAGWSGPVNHTGDTGEIAAVLRDWEDRFGVRVVGVGADTLSVSVAAPPRDREAALRVAAEHFAFCPDTVWQGRSPYTLAAYADRLVDRGAWTFWWD
jgi:hypothetical protein